MRRGATIGLLCGLATLCKLSAIGLIALPMLVALCPRRYIGWRSAVAQLLAFGFSFGLVISLWAARNFEWTGNPFFPIATSWFGSAHWTGEQASRWARAHSSDLPLIQRITLLFSAERGLAHIQFGWLFWPASLLGASLAIRQAAYRKVVISMLLFLSAQLAFWLFFTHLMSRFLIPLLLPGCVLIGLGMATMLPWQKKLTAFALMATLSLLSFGLYFTHRGRTAAQFIDGIALLRNGFEPNRTLNQLPLGSRVYAEGFATPFYIRTPMTYHTTWDSSPLGEAMGRGGPERAIQWLQSEGFTHLLIDWHMLRLCWTPGNYGYDPAVTPEVLEKVTRSGLSLVHADASSSLQLYAVPRRKP